MDVQCNVISTRQLRLTRCPQSDPRGRFTAKSALGSETGEALLQGGALVVPLVEHNGTLHLVRDGETLKGPGVLRGKTWEVSLVRTERIVSK